MKYIAKSSLYLFTVAVLTIGALGIGAPIVLAAPGEGTATVNGVSNVNVQISSSGTYTIVLTVGVSGIGIDADHPAFTIPAGFTAPEAAPESLIGDVDTDGEWFVSAAGGTCAVSLAGSSGSGQTMLVDVTGACASGDTITVTYQGTPSIAGAAANIDIQTDDVSGGSPGASIASPPTITVYGTSSVGDHTVGSVASTNTMAGMHLTGGTDVVLGGFSITAVGEGITYSVIRIGLTPINMVIGEISNLRIVEDDGTGGGVANDGIMQAGELADPLATVASPGTVEDVSVSDTIAAGNTDNYFIVGTIAATVTVGDQLIVDAEGTAGTTAVGASSGVSITPTGASANGTRQVTDTTPPTVVNTYSVDTDGDGDIDAVDVEFSEAISDTSAVAAVAANEIEFDNDPTNNSTGEELASGGGTAVTYPASDSDANDEFYRFSLTAGISGTDAVYMHITGTSLTDANGVPIVAADNVGTPNDEALPVLTSAVTDDNDSDGTVDRLTLNFSESVTITDGGTDDDFTLVASSGTASIDAGSYGATATSVTYNITPSVTGDTALTIDPTYATAGAGSVIDSAAHEMSNGETVTGTDGARPVIVSAQTTSDRDIEVTFSENISATGLAGSDLSTDSGADAMDSVSGGGTSVITWTTATAGEYWNTDADGSGAGVGTDATGTNQSNVPNLTIAADAITDTAASPNGIAAVNNSTVTTDGAAPAYVSSVTLDNNGDGTVDYVRIQYSEDIDDTTVSQADFEAGDGGTTGSFLTESFASGQPGTGGQTDVVDDEYIFVGVADGTQTLQAGKTDYTLSIQQVTGIDDALGNTLASFGAQVSGDGAAPVILATSAYSDSDSDGMVDRVTLNFSENANFTMDVTDWAFGIAGDVNLSGDFDPTECSGSGSATITCTDAGTGTFAADPDKTGGTTAPRWDYSAGTPANINDGNGNNAAAANVTLGDAAAPLPVSATLDYNDNVSELVVTFSEPVTAASTDETLFHINDITGTDDVTLSQMTTSGDGITQAFPLTEAERAAALLISGVTGGDAGAVVLDVDAGAVTETAAGSLTSPLVDNIAVAETADTNPPTLDQWDVDFTSNQFTLTFSETVDVSTLDWTTVTVQDAATSTSSYTLTGGSTASGDGTTVVLDLNVTDLNAIKSDDNIVTSSADSWIVITNGLIDDIGQNNITAITNGSALQANSYTGSGSLGGLTATHLLLSNNTVGHVANATVQFTLENDLPVDGKIVIDFPAGFYVGSATSIENADFGTAATGTFMVTVSGNRVMVTRQNDGDIVPGGTAVDFDIVQVFNPTTEGATGYFAFATKTTAEAVIDQNTTVSPQVITIPPAGGQTTTVTGGGGGGGSSNPVIKVAGLVKEEEAKAAAEAAEEATTATHEAAPASGELATGFIDTFGHWAEGYINAIAAQGIVQGKDEDIFAPDDNISRAELLKIALNSYDYDVPDSVEQAPLPDVQVGDWFAPYVKSAFDNEIIYGFENGIDPNTPASRGMAATILVKSAGFDDVMQHFIENYTNHEDWAYAGFPDVAIDAYFAPYVAYLADMQIVSGYPDGTFGPGKPITRAEIAKIIVNLLGLNPIASEPPEEEVVTTESTGEEEEMMEGQGLETPIRIDEDFGEVFLDEEGREYVIVNDMIMYIPEEPESDLAEREAKYATQADYGDCENISEKILNCTPYECMYTTGEGGTETISILGEEGGQCRVDYAEEGAEEPKQCIHSDYTLPLIAETYYQSGELAAGNISEDDYEILIDGIAPDQVDLLMIVDECDPEQTGL